MNNCRESAENKRCLIVELYERAIRHLKGSIGKIKAEKYSEAEQRINKALEIIHELNDALDIETGGDIAQNLRRVYAFTEERLGQAKKEKDASMIQGIIALLQELNRGWRIPV